MKRLRFMVGVNRDKYSESTSPSKPLKYMDISAVNPDGSLRGPQEMLFENAPSRARRLAYEGDTVVSTVRTYLKAIAFVDRAHSDCVWSTGFAVLTPGPELDPRFLYYVARSPWFVASIQQRSVGVGYPAVNPDDVTDISCPVPPLDEQRRIADFLEQETTRLRELMQLREELALLLPERLRATMHSAIAGLPRNGKLAYAGTWYSGGTPPKDEPEHWSGSVPWASTKDLSSEDLEATLDHISPEAAQAHSRIAPRGSVLIATRGMALAKRLPLAVTGSPTAFNQDLKALVPAPGIEAAYLRIVLRGYEPELLGAVVESAHGTRRLETRHLKGLRVPIPDVKARRRIVNEVREVEAHTHDTAGALEKQMELLNERRDALITAAVTGELDPSSYRGSAVT